MQDIMYPMKRKAPLRRDTLGYRCLYCSRIFWTSQAIAGHQKAHRFDANWRKGIHHLRIPVPVQRRLPMAYPLVRSEPCLVASPNEVVPPPPFLPPPASMVRSNPIPFSLDLQLVNPGVFPLMANLPALSTNVKGCQPVARAKVPNHMFRQAFPNQMARGNPNLSSLQPAESQDSSATVVDERVWNHIKGKEVEVHQQLKNSIDLELRL